MSQINKSDSEIINLHFVIAILCTPLYIYGGEFFKFIAIPYVLFMVFSLKQVYMPALFVHFMHGSTISFAILIGCFILSILKKRDLKKMKLNLLLILALIPFPLILYTAYVRYFNMHQSIIEIIEFQSMYFGFFSFFYSVLVFKKINYKINKYLLVILFLAIIISFIIEDFYVRYVFFAIPYLFITLMNNYFNHQKINYIYLISIFIFLIIGFLIDTTTTLIFTSFIGALILLLYYKLYIFVRYSTAILFILTFFLLISAIRDFNLSNNSESGYNIEVQKISFSDPSSILNRANYKLTEDRAPLWAANFKNYVLNGSLMPSLKNKEYEFETINGFKFESEIAAHNIYLQLFKYYGLIIGSACSLLYVLLIFKISYVFEIKKINFFVVAVAATIISIGFFGGFTGQYTLLINFSFLYFGMGGLVYKYYHQNKIDLNGKN